MQQELNETEEIINLNNCKEIKEFKIKISNFEFKLENNQLVDENNKCHTAINYITYIIRNKEIESFKKTYSELYEQLKKAKINFGKFKGVLLIDIFEKETTSKLTEFKEMSYLKWCIYTS